MMCGDPISTDAQAKIAVSVGRYNVKMTLEGWLFGK